MRFPRLVFQPLNALIVAAARWRIGQRTIPRSVILPIAVYEELLERAEDAEDIAWLKRARKKPMHYRPLEEVLRS